MLALGTSKVAGLICVRGWLLSAEIGLFRRMFSESVLRGFGHFSGFICYCSVLEWSQKCPKFSTTAGW